MRSKLNIHYRFNTYSYILSRNSTLAFNIIDKNIILDITPNMINAINNYLKNFTGWFQLKPNLDSNNSIPPLVSEGQIWWVQIGENIGTEISGKGPKFTRPGIIYKKLSRYTFLIIPTSSKIKEGSWYSKFTFNSIEMVGSLNQIRIIDYRRLDNKMGVLDELDYSKIKLDFQNLYNFSQ